MVTNEERILRARLTKAIILVITVFALGVVGYRVIEGWNFLDSIWMTVITLTTVGFGEIHPLSNAGRIFTIGLILSGLGIMGYGLGIIATFIVEGELSRFIGRRRMEKEISKLSNHYIVCGAGQTGRRVAEEFYKTKTPFVAIESDPVKLELLNQLEGIYVVSGDATKDSVLLNAGIKKARGLVSALSNDRDNVFVVLTARALNRNLRIVARVVESESEHKLISAGADEVVSPNYIGGLRMASIMIRPAVVSFLDVMLRDQNSTLRLEEVRLLRGTPMVGRTLRESQIVAQTGLIVIAIKQNETGEYIYNPKPDTVLDVDDTLIVMGNVDQVVVLRKLVGDGLVTTG